MGILLLTRPQAQSEAFATLLAEDSIDSVICPMLTIHPRDIAPPEEIPQAMLITSANALPALAQLSLTVPLLCVGEQTAAQAHSHHPQTVCTGEMVDELIAWITQHLVPDDGPLLYLSGSHITRDLQAALPDFTVHRLVCYDAIAAEQIDPAILEDISAVCFFSSRTAEIFQSLPTVTPELTRSLTALCLSEQIAAVLQANNWRAIYHSDRPTAESMRGLIGQYHQY